MGNNSPLRKAVELVAILLLWATFFSVLIGVFCVVSFATQPALSIQASIAVGALCTWLVSFGSEYSTVIRSPHTGWLWVPTMLSIGAAGCLTAAGSYLFLHPQSSLLQSIPSGAVLLIAAYAIPLLGLPLVLQLTTGAEHGAHQFMRSLWQLVWKLSSIVVALFASLLVFAMLYNSVAMHMTSAPLTLVISAVLFLHIVRYGIEWRRFWNWSERSLPSNLLLIATALVFMWFVDSGLWNLMYAGEHITSSNAIIIFVLICVAVDCAVVFGAPLMFLIISQPSQTVDQDVSSEFAGEGEQSMRAAQADEEELGGGEEQFGSSEEDEFGKL